jgi:hypothetical protein
MEPLTLKWATLSFRKVEVATQFAEWTLVSYTTRTLTSVDSGDDGSEYVDVYFDIKITRKPNYYILTFIWPSFLITCLSIIGIFSPFNEAGEREEKVTMGLTTLLTMAVILMIITGDMPKSSNGIPLLGTKISSSFLLPKRGYSPRWKLRLKCASGRALCAVGNLVRSEPNRTRLFEGTNGRWRARHCIRRARHDSWRRHSFAMRISSRSAPIT